MEQVEGADNVQNEFKIFVSRLSPDTTEDSMREYFEQFGTLTEVKIIMEHDSHNKVKSSKGYGFAVFESEESMNVVLSPDNVANHMIDGRRVEVKRSIPHALHQAARNRTRKVFVGNVPEDMQEDTIRQHFKQFGEIALVEFPTVKGDPDKRRDFVFVSFEKESSVDSSTQNVHQMIQGHKVEVKRAAPSKDQSNNAMANKRGGAKRILPYGGGAYGGGFGVYGRGAAYNSDEGYGYHRGYDAGGYGAAGGYGYRGAGGAYSAGGYGPDAGGYRREFGGRGSFGEGFGSGSRGGYGPGADMDSFNGGGNRGRGGAYGMPRGRGGDSRYGPMKTAYSHSAGAAAYHPYRR